MENNEQRRMEYESDKGKMKISGTPEEVNNKIWFNMIMRELRWIIPVIILLCLLPKASLLPFVFRWLRLTLFVVVAVQLSG
jgi:hypothetical protein